MKRKGYLSSGIKAQCFGCEACIQVCCVNAIKLVTDEEGFRYPQIAKEKCVKCGRCETVCPASELPNLNNAPLLAFGGYALDEEVRSQSTSGGFFSILADAWCSPDTIVFGAESIGLGVRHSYARHGEGISKFRKSKYLQSEIGTSYKDARRFLDSGHKVLFSGTPCQIAGLRKFLGEKNYKNLLTIEVVCEGVPTPHYIERFAKWLGTKLDGEVETIDYRYKDGRRWDFEVMQATLQNPTHGVFKWKQDRWFNSFWSIWLQHLISRPSCYECPFATRQRNADITLGDLWGVHLYCPELYGRNGGASVAFCNSEKGVEVLSVAQKRVYGHELPIETAIKYQGPMRKHIEPNAKRDECMADLQFLPFDDFIKKHARKPTLKLLFQKYIWGNRQKVWLWNLINRKKINEV